MIEYNFKSQPATTIEQSQRLLDMGVRKETADMTHHYLHSTDSYELKDIEFSRIMHLQEMVNKKPVLGRNGDDLYSKDIPAWSLHRLIEMMPVSLPCGIEGMQGLFSLTRRDDGSVTIGYTWSLERTGNIYDAMISAIEWLIKNEDFSNEYVA